MEDKRAKRKNAPLRRGNSAPVIIVHDVRPKNEVYYDIEREPLPISWLIFLLVVVLYVYAVFMASDKGGGPNAPETTYLQTDVIRTYKRNRRAMRQFN